MPARYRPELGCFQYVRDAEMTADHLVNALNAVQLGISYDKRLSGMLTQIRFENSRSFIKKPKP